MELVDTSSVERLEVAAGGVVVAGDFVLEAALEAEPVVCEVFVVVGVRLDELVVVVGTMFDIMVVTTVGVLGGVAAVSSRIQN